MTHEHHIAIERWPAAKGEYAPRGRKVVIVDGVQWGVAHPEGHGTHGSRYWFQQIGLDGAIEEPHGRKVTGKGRSDLTITYVWSDKRHKRDINFNPWANPPMIVKSVDERLLEAATRLVSTGRLRHPDVVQAERTKFLDELAAASKREEDAAAREFEMRADLICGQIAAPADTTLIKDQIIKAMRWAQTQ